MPGGLLQLVLYGAEDIYLTGNPQVSYFKTAYKRYTNFALETINLPFNQVPNISAGATILNCQIQRYADLLKSVYLKIKLPSVYPYNYKFNYIDNPIKITTVINGVQHPTLNEILLCKLKPSTENIQGFSEVEGYLYTNDLNVINYIKTNILNTFDFVGYLNYPIESNDGSTIKITTVQTIDNYKDIIYSTTPGIPPLPEIEFNNLPVDPNVGYFPYVFIHGIMNFIISEITQDQNNPGYYYLNYQGLITDSYFYDYTISNPINPNSPHFWINYQDYSNNFTNSNTFNSGFKLQAINEFIDMQGLNINDNDILNLDFNLNNQILLSNGSANLLSSNTTMFNYSTNYNLSSFIFPYPLLPSPNYTQSLSSLMDVNELLADGTQFEIINNLIIDIDRTLNDTLNGTISLCENITNNQLLFFADNSTMLIPNIQTFTITINPTSYSSLFSITTSITVNVVNGNIVNLTMTGDDGVTTVGYVLNSGTFANNQMNVKFENSGIIYGEFTIDFVNYAPNNYLLNTQGYYINGIRNINETIVGPGISLPFTENFTNLYYPGSATGTVSVSTSIITLNGTITSVNPYTFSYTSPTLPIGAFNLTNLKIPFNIGYLIGNISGNFDGVNLSNIVLNLDLYYIISEIVQDGESNIFTASPQVIPTTIPQLPLYVPTYNDITLWIPKVNPYDNQINYIPGPKMVGNNRNFRWVLNVANKIYFILNKQEICRISSNGLYADIVGKLETQKLNIFNRMAGVVPQLLYPDVVDIDKLLQIPFIGDITANGIPYGYPTPEYTLYIPSCFWFAQNPGQALPLIALQSAPIDLRLDMYSSGVLNTPLNGFAENQWYTGLPYGKVEVNDLSIDATYIYLDKDERIKFVNGAHQYLITQYQERNYDIRSTKQTYNIDFAHPVSEFLFYAANGLSIESYPFSGIFPLRPDVNFIKNMRILFNGYEREQNKTIMFYNSVQPFEFHPGDFYPFINMYSFSLDPYSIQPKGACNFTRVNNFQLEVEFDPKFINTFVEYDNEGNIVRILDPATGLYLYQYINVPSLTNFYIMGKNYNILSIESNVGGVKFAT